MISHSVLVIGPQGSGKSYFADSVLRHYGSGIVVLARGLDEANSYYPLTEHPNFEFRGFDDPGFQPALGEKVATGAADAVRWLGEMLTLLQGMKPEDRPKVLVFDTATALGDLAMNAALAKFGRTEPPPVRGEQGFPFFSYLDRVQQGIFSKGRAIRDLGVHWIVLAQAAERETTPEQASQNVGMLKKQVMAAVPGGFRDKVGQYFDNVLQAQAVNVAGKPPSHQLLWLPDAQRNTKTRLGALTSDLKPVTNDWRAVLPLLDRLVLERRERLANLPSKR